jgi:hypothetical protein
MPGGDKFATAAEMAEVRGEKAGFAAMGSMRDGAPVSLGMRIVWCQAAKGGRIEHRNRDKFRDLWRFEYGEKRLTLALCGRRRGGGGVSADCQVRERHNST